MAKSLGCVLGLHDYSDWENIGSCKQIISCRRCGIQRDEKTSHESGNWEYKHADSCEQVQICRKCGIQLGKRIQHESIGEWKSSSGVVEIEVIETYPSRNGEASNEAKCIYAFNISTGVCRRCGSFEQCTHSEKWITYRGTVGYSGYTAVCRHCGAEGHLVKQDITGPTTWLGGSAIS